MAQELDKVIKVGGVDYNINAVEADHVKNSLKINKANLASDGSTKLAEFDGTAEVSINLVPTDGGKFRGPIRVYNAGTELTDNKNKHTSGDSAGEFFEDAVLNYHDIKDVVLANIKNNTIVYNWSGTTLTNDPTFDNAINTISIVQGPETQASTFATSNNNRYNEYLAEIEESGKSNIKYLPTYLYVGTTENKVYYGTADSTTAKLLAINSAGQVASADKLTNSCTIRTDLGSTQAVGFNGTADIAPGVTGVLPLANGGLGGDISTNSDAAQAVEYYINGSITQTTDPIEDGTWMLFQRNSPSKEIGQYGRKSASALWTYISKKIRGNNGFGFTDNKVLKVENGGTGKTTIGDIVVGKAQQIRTELTTKTSNTSSISQQYATISISPNDPSGGNVGDIWIKYSN